MAIAVLNVVSNAQLAKYLTFVRVFVFMCVWKKLEQCTYMYIEDILPYPVLHYIICVAVRREPAEW